MFDFDFSRAAIKDRPPTMGGEWSGDLTILEDGVLNAIIFWHEIWLDDEATISTAPDEAETCWLQAYQPMEEIRVSKGSKLPMKVRTRAHTLLGAVLSWPASVHALAGASRQTCRALTLGNAPRFSHHFWCGPRKM